MFRVCITILVILVCAQISSAEWHCGAGPVTGMCAALATTSCDHFKIDKCCWIHDRCYEKLHLNQTYCDDEFCKCLDSIPGNSYCTILGQPSLCLATRVFGHNFHWSATIAKNNTDEEFDPIDQSASFYSSVTVLFYLVTFLTSTVFLVFYWRHESVTRIVNKLLDFEIWE